MSEGVPYYPLVKPEVPVADNTAAKIIASSDLAGSFLHGLTAFGNLAAQRQRNELELKQLAQETHLKEESFGLQKQKLEQDFNIKKELLPLQEGLLRSHAAAYSATANANASAANNLLDYKKNVANAVIDFQSVLKKTDLLNPNPKNPMQAYADYADVAQQFSNADIPQIKSTLAALKARFDGFKIPLPNYGASPAGDKFVGGARMDFSPGQIIAQLQDPTTAPIMTNALRDAGMIVPTEKVKTQSGDEVVTGVKTQPWLQSWIDSSQGVTMKPHTAARPGVAMMSQWMAKSGAGGAGTATTTPTAVQKIRVLSPDGKSTGFIPAGQLDAAMKQGYKQLPDTSAPSPTDAASAASPDLTADGTIEDGSTTSDAGDE